MLDFATDESGAVRLSPMGGMPCAGCMQLVHHHLRPRSYLQIGAAVETLLPASCPTVAVDPLVDLGGLGGKPRMHLFRMAADDFFAAHDPVRILGREVDLTFLDGMHLCENLLRDFINAERCAAAGGMIVLGDCVPLDLEMALRDRETAIAASAFKGWWTGGWWTGDVWKMVAVLRRYRPELRIAAYDAPPTGLVLVTGLAPGSDLLAARYRDVVADMRALDGVADYRAYLDWLAPSSTDGLEASLAAFAVA